MANKRQTRSKRKTSASKRRQKRRTQKREKEENKEENPLPDTFEHIQTLDHDKEPVKKFESTHEPMNWGLGVEHEMHIFHKARGGMKDTNILFDSQEGSCFLTGERNPEGSCKKLRNGDNYYSPPKKVLKKMLELNKTKLTREEKEIIAYLDWEQSGKYIGTCKYKSVLPRVKVLMPEFVTGNFKNRSIDSISEELFYLEDTYLNFQMKNPVTQKKVKKYGKLVTHLCGTHNNIKVPIRPTIYDDEYMFDEDGDGRAFGQKDYLGSYHVTLTLPHRPDIKKKEFVQMHEDMANQLQWLEPLFIASYFGPDQDSVGSKEPRVKGAFRPMTVGWGVPAASDVRTFGTEGIGRVANIKTYWRDKTKFKNEEDNMMKYCVDTAKPPYKKGRSILGSDFRTFNYENNMKKCQRLYTPYDCPKVDGGIMEPPYGMEFRIFDHFPKEYLPDMLRVIVLVAANAKRHPPTKYVYKNSSWGTAISTIMKEGWNAELSEAYIKLLRDQLGIPINMPTNTDPKVRSNSKIALDVFKQVVHELFTENKDSFITQLLNENPDIEPKVPELNRMCWEMECNSVWMTKLIEILRHIKKDKKITAKSTKIPLSIFRKYLFSSEKMGSKGKWKNDVTDVLYTLETYNKVSLIYKGGYKISHFCILI